MPEGPRATMPPAEPGFDPDLLPTVLDRLIGVPVGGEGVPRGLRRSRVARLARIEAILTRGGGPGPARGSPADWIVAAVKEDLRCLLNARRAVEGLEEGDPLNRSVLGYGLADLGDRAIAGPDGADLLREAVLDAVRRFEPRLSRVAVEVDPARPSAYVMRLRISGVLELGARPRPVAFDTLMRLTTREIVVEERARGTEAGGVLPA